MSYGKFYAIEVIGDVEFYTGKDKKEKQHHPILKDQKMYWNFCEDAYGLGGITNDCLSSSSITARIDFEHCQEDPKNKSVRLLELELVEVKQPAESKENDPLNRAIDEIREK